MPQTSKSNASQCDVIVAGGGVVGLTIAWRAAQRGLSVALFERDEIGRGTSWVAAGMLAPVTEAHPRELPVLRLGLASARSYPAFVDELREASGLDPGYLRCGALVVARDGDEAEALDRAMMLRSELGLAVERLRPSEARRHEPSLAPSLRLALEIPTDHAIDPRRLCAALAKACIHTGVELRTGTGVNEILVAGDAVKGVGLSDGSQVLGEQVVVAAGVWSTGIGGIPDPARVPIHPVKGQLLRLHDPAGPGLLKAVLRMMGSYLVPRGDGTYVLGATMEERGFDTTVTVGAAFELLRDATEVVPGLSELAIDELIAGLRPATPDNTPAIGPGGLEGLHWAVGHFRNGVLLAPITAEIVLSTLASGEPHELAHSCDPARFTGLHNRSPSATRTLVRS